MSRRRAKLLLWAVLAAFAGDLFLDAWTAELIAGVALAVALCCLPGGEED